MTDAGHWRPVSEFLGYRVDRTGQVWCCLKRGRGGGVETDHWRPVKSWTCRDGYAHVDMRDAGKRYSRVVARVVLEAFVGPCPGGCEAHYRNGDRTDCSVDNVYWGPYNALKMTPEVAGRAGAMAGVTRREMARRLGVNAGTLRKAIKTGKVALPVRPSFDPIMAGY